MKIENIVLSMLALDVVMNVWCRLLASKHHKEVMSTYTMADQERRAHKTSVDSCVAVIKDFDNRIYALEKVSKETP